MKPIQFLMIARTWMRSGLSSAISLVSLSIGLLCSIMLLLFTVKEYRIAESLGVDDNVYFIETPDNWNKGQYSSSIFKTIPLLLADNYPEIASWAVIHNMSGKWNDISDNWQPPYVVGVTPNTLELLNIKALEGSLDSVLAAPGRVAITRAYANELFSEGDAIGQTLEGITGTGTSFNGISQEKHHSLTVMAILDDAHNSFIKMRALTLSPEVLEASMQNQSGQYYGIIRLNNGVSPDDLIAKIVADTINNEPYKDIRLTSLKDIYFSDAAVSQDSMLSSRNEQTLIIGITIAILVLVIAAFNYINITLTRAPRRLKNLAGQRIMGASENNVRAQIFVDTALNVVLALVIVVFLMPACMQIFNSFMGSSLEWTDLYALENLPYIMALLVLLIVIPSLNLMVKFAIHQPMEVFKNPRGNKLHSTQTLVIVQMVMSVVLIAFSINVTRQMDFVVDTIPASSQVLQLEGDIRNPMPQEFVDRLKASASTLATSRGWMGLNNSNGEEDGFRTLASNVDPNYFDVLGLKLIAGRTFDSTFSKGVSQVVVNEAFVRAKELKEPIGYEYKSWKESSYVIRIVGVCPDFTTTSVASEVQPANYSRIPSSWGNFAFVLRFAGSKEDKIAEINNLYEKYAPENPVPIKISTVEDFYKDANLEIVRLQIIINFFACVSIFLTAFGLFGLSWYTVERRRKEIALRKIHGSTTIAVVSLLSRSFFLWTAISAVIALPLGFYITGRWLEAFVYRIDNSLWTLAITLLAAAGVTFITVIFQTWRAASANPAKAIKME